MEDLELPTTAAHLGAYFDAPIVGDRERRVERLSALEVAGSGCLAFFANRKYSEFLPRLNGAVVLTSEDLVDPQLPVTYIVVLNPQLAFARVASRFVARPKWEGVSPQAVISRTAKLAEGVSVGPFAYIGERAVIGAHTRIYPYVYVGDDTEIGCESDIYPHVSILERVRIADRVKIFPGTIIGSDGFGLIEGRNGLHGRSEMPQIGTVIIESDVRIGANCTIDRGTLSNTRIEKGAKIDDLVHVGHNCVVGRHSVLCAQVGLGGSTVLEEDVILGGQVGLGHGVRVGKGARMGGQSGSSTNVRGGDTYFCTPATPIKDFARILKYWRKLPEIWQRLKSIEARLNDIESR